MGVGVRRAWLRVMTPTCGLQPVKTQMRWADLKLGMHYLGIVKAGTILPEKDGSFRACEYSGA